MSRVVLVVDVGRGQEAMIFPDLHDAQSFLDRHQAIEECTQGMVPVSARREVIRAANQQVEGGDR